MNSDSARKLRQRIKRHGPPGIDCAGSAVGKSDPIRAHLGCLRDVKRWLKAARADGVVIGGIAAGLLGTPRVTKDVEILVVIDDGAWSQFVRCGRPFGFESR